VCLCGAKAPIGCKKYPAVAGYFIKWTINGPKREVYFFLKEWLFWIYSS
jgi:hypothetical protein